jgi:hypothetical protein
VNSLSGFCSNTLRTLLKTLFNPINLLSLLNLD